MIDTKLFIKLLRELKLDNTEQMLRKYSEVAMRASFYLNVRKNNKWLGQKVLMFKCNLMFFLLYVICLSICA